MIDPKISLIHATPLAMKPITTAFESLWPQAQLMNLLDDRLGQDLAQAGSLNDVMVTRMVSLAQYAKTSGAQGILFTCSAFGAAIDEAKHVVGLPTLKPNEAMFDEALDICALSPQACRIGLLTTFAPAEKSMYEELVAAKEQRGVSVQIVSACAHGAMEALNAGDATKHDQLIIQSAKTLPPCDVLLLGQFSMSRAQHAVADAMKLPVLSSPESAVRRLKAELD